MWRQKAYIVVLVLIGVLLAGPVFPNLFDHSTHAVLAAPAPQLKAEQRKISSLRDLSDAFVEIAANVNPTVVTVFTEKIYRVRDVYSPFGFYNDPFEEFWNEFFFGTPRRQRPQPREREYRQQGLGSGVIVSKDGYILTNNHVVRDADSIYVRTIDDETYPAKVVGTDAKTDIAVLKIKAKNLKPIKLGDSDKLRVGEIVLAIGSPLNPNLDHTVTQGIVSAKGRSNVGLADYEDFIQTDAAINPGNSGGALVNLDGELIGINTAIATQSGGFQGIGFAVPINMAKNVMEQLIKRGKVVRGWLGVTIQDINQTMSKALGLKSREGALVGDVVKDSPADKAGLKPGDVIIAVDGKKIKNSTQLRNQIAGTEPGTKVKLTILRDKKEKTIKVKLGELPQEGKPGMIGKETQELLGFTVQNMSRELAEKYNLDKSEKGVVITRIDRRSAAFRAGLREGDLIKSVNRQRVKSVKDFNKVVKDLKKGDTVLLYVQRATGNFFIAFTL